MGRVRGSRSIVALALCAGGCIPNVSWLFSEIAYPHETQPVPPRNLVLSFDATVAPPLLAGFQYPEPVGRCLLEIASSEAVLDRMYAAGGCFNATSGDVVACAPGTPWLRGGGDADGGPTRYEIAFPCSTAITSPQDRVQLALALTDASGATSRYVTASRGDEGGGAPLDPARRNAFARAVYHAGSLLAADPVRLHDTALPVLALSGGAANGAFVAGFVHALLWSREKARALVSDAQKPVIDGYRFGGMFGNSVGTLVGLPLDLYFSERAPSPPERQALEACLAGAPRASGGEQRLAQDCALTLLERYFAVNEWDLLCAQPGLVTELVKKDVRGMLRFDPLTSNILDPFFASYQSLTLFDGFHRVAVSTDLEQSLYATIDERACLLPGMSAAACQREMVLASIAAPVFVPGREKIYTGLDGARGESGWWVDGGVRSVNPATRAVTYTTGKVLTINTNRAEGIPAGKPAGIFGVAFQGMQAAVDQIREWELEFAGLYQLDRDRRACALGALVGDQSLCPGALVTAGPGLGGSERVRNVWVPEEIRPTQLFAAGYTFDPLVMQGLFAWGERTFLQHRMSLYPWLGWCDLARLEGIPCGGTPGLPNPAYQAAIADLLRRVDAAVAALLKYENPVTWQAHVDERRGLLQKHMTECARN